MLYSGIRLFIFMQKSQYLVSSLGNAIVDILSFVDESFLQEQKIPKGSMRVVSNHASIALYQKIPPAVEQSGGSAANTISGISSLGGKTAYIGKVADDFFGKIFKHDLQALNSEFIGLEDNNEEATGRSIILVTPDAERTMNTYLGASTNLQVADIKESVVTNSQIFLSEGYLWHPIEARYAIMHALNLCKKQGGKFAFTLSDVSCVMKWRLDFLTFIKENVDILVGNQDEFEALFLGSLPAFLDDLQAFAECIIITRGDQGSIVIHQNKKYEIPAYMPEKIVDKTGAGDMYLAGFLWGYANAYDAALCGKLGALCATEIISHLGSRPERSLAETILPKVL